MLKYIRTLGTLSSVIGHIVQHSSLLAEGIALLCWLVILSISLTKVLCNYTRFKKNKFFAFLVEGGGGGGAGYVYI